MLEAALHGDNAFVTLTYRDEKIPRAGPDGLPTLSPAHARDWLKRFRAKISPTKIRYYLVGEYGDETQRPHYHVALFGYPTCSYVNSRYSRSRQNCCHSCDLVRDTWGLGQVMLGTLETASAGYVAGYVTKKLTNKNDPRLLGRAPEFARMSLRPGIGADFMHEVASTVLQFDLEEATQGDVPSSLRHGSRTLPLGRYLRRKLRTLVGKDPHAPQTPTDPEMLALQVRARGSTENPSLKSQVVLANAPKALSLETRTKIHQRGKKL